MDARHSVAALEAVDVVNRHHFIISIIAWRHSFQPVRYSGLSLLSVMASGMAAAGGGGVDLILSIRQTLKVDAAKRINPVSVIENRQRLLHRCCKGFDGFGRIEQQFAQECAPSIHGYCFGQRRACCRAALTRNIQCIVFCDVCHGWPFSGAAVHDRFAYVSAAVSMLSPRKSKPTKINHPAKKPFMLHRLS